MTKPHSDQLTHQFMVNIGATLTLNCNESYSTYRLINGMELPIHRTKTCRSTDDLYILLSEIYFEKGRSAGKQDVIEIFHKKLTNIILEKE
jgi:hypothetical protein